MNFKLVVTVICCALVATALQGQTSSPYGTTYAGDKSVWNYNSSNSSWYATDSHAYIDAYAALGSNSGADVCTAIQTALTALATYQNYPGEAAVIDARGVLPPSGQTWQLCSSTSLWQGASNYPVIVLLPSGTILLQKPWQLPSGTKLVGEGVGGTGLGTIIQACSSSTTGCNSTAFSGTAMIEMGLTSGCTGTSVEQLTLDGYEITPGVNGILNQYCGDLSYVDHVWLYRILGFGLTVIPGAEHSGPYSNITFNTADASTPSTTICRRVGKGCSRGRDVPRATPAILESVHPV